MKRIVLSGVLACSMLAVIPVDAAEFLWQRMADPPPTTSDFNWSTAGYWRGGSLPQAEADIGFFLYFSDEYLDSPVPTTVIYDVPDPIRFDFVNIIDTVYLTPLTLRIDAPYTFSANDIMVQDFGTLALHGGTVIADYEATVGGTSADGVVSAGVILQTAGTNTISHTLDIAIGAYNLVGGVLSASRELVESAGNFFQSGGTNTAATLLIDGTFTQDGGYTFTDALTVGERGVGTFVLRGGSLDAGIETLGTSSAGVFTQSGGTNTAGSILIGSQAFGTYTLSNGTIDAFGMEINNGVFNQSGGINNLTTAVIGMSDGFIGQYDFSGGALSANAVFVGNHGPGNFLHTGGTSNVNELTIGANGASGTYRLEGTGLIASPARLTGGVEYIGYSGTGVFDHYGSLDSVHTSGLLHIGYDTGGNGSYTMHGNVLLEAGDEVVGRAGNGSFTQHMGTHRIGAVTLKPGEAAVGTGTLTIGELLGGTGVYSMNPTVGTPELWASTEVIGSYGTGTFTQFGGTNTVAGDLYLGRYATGVGSYTLSGASASPTFLPGFPPPPSTPATVVSAVNEYIGDGGTGVFTHTGGENSLSGSLFLGGNNAGSTGYGTYALSGGKLSAASEYVGSGGTGIFRQSGGMNVAGNLSDGGLRVGGELSGAGTYELSGGILFAGSMQVGTGGGTGTFDHAGGNNNVSNVLTIGANGTYNLSGEDSFGSGGRLSAGGIINDGTFNFSGGELSAYSLPSTGGPPYTTGPDFTNNGTFNIGGTGDRFVSASVLNNGTVKTTDTSVTFSGTFTNNGAYISDPSSNYFTDLTVNSDGHLVGGAGDRFFIGGDFLNYSTQNGSWDTALAYLTFTGTGLPQEFYFGNVGGNGDFSWGTLEISVGGILQLDGIGDLYVSNLILGDGSFLNLGGGSIYYDTLTDNGGSYVGDIFRKAGGGDGTNPVPEPSTWLLLASGLAGLCGFGKHRRRRTAPEDTSIPSIS